MTERTVTMPTTLEARAEELARRIYEHTFDDPQDVPWAQIGGNQRRRISEAEELLPVVESWLAEAWDEAIEVGRGLAYMARFNMSGFSELTYRDRPANPYRPEADRG